MKERGHNYEKPKQKKIDSRTGEESCFKPLRKRDHYANFLLFFLFPYFFKAHFDKLCKNKGKFIYI